MKKYLNSIIIILLFILFSFFNSKEYFLFHSEGKKDILNIEKTKDKVSNFSFDKIREIEGLEIYKTPDKNLLKTLVEKIKNAKSRIYIEAYIFTEKEIRTSLIKAKKSGVDVKVIMEKNVYLANNINKKTFEEFVKNNIEVIWSDSSDYVLNHSKFFIIDDELLLSTGNFSYSMFTKNRDFMLFIKDKLISEKILANFDFDYNKDKKFIYDDNFVLSPFYSREKIEFLLKNAKKEILIYFPYFNDIGLQSILEDKLNEGLDIKIITDKKNEKTEEFKSIGFNVKVLDKYTEHAKVIIIDGAYVYLGSVNFSTSSLDRNKETGILFTNKEIIIKIKNFFQEDFK